MYQSENIRNDSEPPQRTQLTNNPHLERRLQIDNVLATQPEVGPIVPDGGYGWIVVVSSVYIKKIIPSLSIAYGIFLMFSTIETGKTNDGIFTLWSNKFVYTPLFYISFQTISDPLSHVIIKNSKWPRFVSLCGICLVCASILMLWLSIVDNFAPTTLSVISGIFAGFGTSLILTQIDVIILQYFRLKLPSVQTILRTSEAIGFIFTSLLLGKYLNKFGLTHTITWYHLVLLLSGLAVLLLKKPDYLKGKKSVYSVIRHRHNSEDEEDIFSKTTELQSPHTSLPSSRIESELPSTTTTTTITENPNTTVSANTNWERFSDDDDDDDDEGKLPTPRELFTEGQINNNVTYSFDNVDNVVSTNFGTDDTANIFLPVTNPQSSYAFFTNLSFYKTCLLHIAMKYSAFVFYTLFPSYLYFSISFLHKESITRIISIGFISILLAALFIGKWKVSRTSRAFHIALLLWISAVGNFLISDIKREIALVMGGIIVSTCLFALEYIAKPLVVNTGKAKTEYAVLKFISGISFLMFLIFNSTYENCFRLVGLLQFSTGTIWFCNFVYKKILSVQ